MATSPPELRSIFDPTTCVRKGLCPVTKIRSKKGEDQSPFESHSLYFEQHGNGDTKILAIMGLNSSSFAWTPQVDYFSKQAGYSVLVFDNRGVGNSGTPRGPYTTSDMAEDIIVLLEYVGWTAPRDLHVVGISLGGMIAQGIYQTWLFANHTDHRGPELAYRIPQNILSLTLAVTTPGGHPWSNLPSDADEMKWKGLSSLARLTFMTDPEEKIPIILEMVFPVSWLDSPAEEDPEGRTNRAVQTEIYRHRIAITRPQQFMGHISQMFAALSHYVSPSRLAKISKEIPKVVIVTGDVDYLVDPRNSDKLKSAMPEAEFVKWENTGHAIHAQKQKEFNALLERTFREGKQNAAKRAE
ncbi:alpha/beta-hydrolase [Punctularia strigosozonata HHB-11173 SS5]|uniref:alpha/beta-hydrolase n=1 Tax=Punctularia strigosozonata (strain HHB-11173) TaxID=741275 RepID=UPI00044163E5|nr:alpha/beta-hydrolase [Punctularia strigosozonata HHB-11173 SS5]EIN07697.1 alpha/beta-hydrolase [Punctularia strigosozonata HHB-11173 SS5]